MASRLLRAWAVAASITALLMTTPGSGLAGVAHASSPMADAAGSSANLSVIVRYEQGAEARVRRAIARVGRVTAELRLINGVAARVPSAALARLRASAGVTAVTPDAAVRLSSTWDAGTDKGSMDSVTKAVGAADVWRNSKYTGAGVGVALLDSGVAPVKGLTTSGKVVNGPDLSFESQDARDAYVDRFGHGTHLAGIIAGRDPEVVAGHEGEHKSQFLGVAPSARIVSVKLAAANGAVDVSQVIAGIDWVVTHRADASLNIRVLNLAFGTNSLQSAVLDPLSFAVEAAWRNGIVVVVSAGNTGAAATRLDMPAVNPFVIAVGASAANKTVTPTDDKVASFSATGNSTRHPDLVAPGTSIVSLRTPGSYVDTHHPAGRVSTDSYRYFRGSGTSQAAAVVSGAAALLLQQRPRLTPNQVKKLLMSTALRLPTSNATAQGAGQLDIRKAIATATPVTSAQSGVPATGLGTLEASRGSAHVTDPVTAVMLTGERDIMGKAWIPAARQQMTLTGTAWVGGTWNGAVWTGSTWTGSSWTARTWSARTWSARTWSSGSWSARTWSGNTWSAARWPYPTG
ncbi:MAG TPA: S8 family serine peptidase [Actinoplanes sp.]|jgi:serine protease AprX